MTSDGIYREKIKYWEGKLWDLLKPLDMKSLVIMSWALEAIRSDRAEAAGRYLDFPEPVEDHKILGRYYIPPWSVDALLNEKLTMGDRGKSEKIINLKVWRAVARLMNTYSGLDNVDGQIDAEPDGIIAAMPRLFWPQYDWQLGFNNITRLGRAWFVYGNPSGKLAFEEKYGIELEVFLKVSFFIYGAVVFNPAVSVKALEGVGLSRADIIKTINIIGARFDRQVQYAIDIRSENIPRSFKRSILKERPICIDGKIYSEKLYIPSRDMLLKRISDGLYYDIVHNPDARRASGEYFERLCFKILRHYSGQGDSVSEEKDTFYGKSADLFWMNDRETSGVIVECKIRRLPHRVLTSPNPWKECQDDFDDVVKGVVQIWRTHHALFKDSTEKIVGLVWQYESWTLMGNSFISRLFLMANAKADNLKIPKSSRIPVALVGHPDFESCLRNYDRESVIRGIELSMDDDFHGFMLHTIIESFAEKKDHREGFDYSEVASESIGWWNEELK